MLKAGQLAKSGFDSLLYSNCWRSNRGCFWLDVKTFLSYETDSFLIKTDSKDTAAFARSLKIIIEMLSLYYWYFERHCEDSKKYSDTMLLGKVKKQWQFLGYFKKALHSNSVFEYWYSSENKKKMFYPIRFFRFNWLVDRICIRGEKRLCFFLTKYAFIRPQNNIILK